MKLRRKYTIVLLLVAIVLSGTVYGGLELYKERVVEQNRNEVNETARLAASQLDASIADHEDFVGFVASRPEASQFNESDRFLDEFVGNSRFFAAQLVDANGTIVDFHGDVTKDVQVESIGSNVSDRPYVSAALAGEVYVGQPEYVNSTGDYLVIFSAPIFEDRHVHGVLAGGIYLDPQTFFGMLGPLSRADQRIAVTDGPATLYGSEQRFERSIQQSSTVESTGWTVTVTRNRAGLLARLRELAIAQGFGVFLVLLSVVAFGVWEYRTTLAQTESLLSGFAALEAGRYDHELSLSSADEWEQIGEGFNALGRSLESRETQVREREQRLQVLNRVLRHNLRNSASVVLGYAEVIRTRAMDDRLVAAVERVERAGADLEALSEKARQFSYTMEERDGPYLLDVATILDDVLETVRARYPSVEIDSSGPSEAWIAADPSIEVALENLCENACEHNDAESPRIRTVVELDDPVVRVRITDNGDGIPEYEQSVLDAGQETQLEHGSGLGLWVAHWAVERSDGTLSFDLDEGPGTTVTVELPAGDP